VAIVSGVQPAIGWEQALTAPLSWVSFPGMPALSCSTSM